MRILVACIGAFHQRLGLKSLAVGQAVEGSERVVVVAAVLADMVVLAIALVERVVQAVALADRLVGQAVA